MRGSVQVFSDYGYKHQELIAEDHNLVVNGAAQTIAEAMTISPSLSSIATASSILDASNYTIQAVSFGKAASGYIKNAHDVLNDLVKQTYAATSALVGYVSGSTLSSYTPPLDFPCHPNPEHTTLACLSIDPFSLVSLGEYQQNMNFIGVNKLQSGIPLLVNAGTGTYPHRDGTTVRLIFKDGTALGATVATSSLPSQINSASGMDRNGFIRKVWGTDPSAGLVVSSTVANVSTLGEVTYTVELGGGDVAMQNIYGGINIMGLWTIDVSDTITTLGKSPPFKFDWDASPASFTYRLFAKKVFLQDITENKDSGGIGAIYNYKPLTVVWRLFFV